MAEEPVQLGKGEYFVMGDNQAGSDDSRMADIGNVKREEIYGKDVYKRQALEHAKKNHNNLVILDTAGRLHIDEEMMSELQEIKKAVEVHQTILVVDATVSYTHLL